MRRIAALTMIVSALVVLGLPAAVAKPDCSGDPPHPSCKGDIAEETVWTCQARYDNGGTAWIRGEWIGTDGLPMERDLTGDGPLPAYYRTDNASGAIPACFDVHPGHFGATQWIVAWDADDGTKIFKRHSGLKMIFEREVHEDHYAELVTTDKVGTWSAGFDLSGYREDYVVDNVVFVAMPGVQDNWVFADGYLTITPDGP